LGGEQSTSELASDGDDAKQLEKAEKAAAVKATNKRKTFPQWGGASKGQQQRPQE